MTSRHKRSKSWGYAVEVAALKALRQVFPYLVRTGSVAYKKNAADLVQAGVGDPPLRLVVTRDKRRPLLVSLTVEDFNALVGRELDNRAVVIQVKARERTWLGSLYQGLREAT